MEMLRRGHFNPVVQMVDAPLTVPASSNPSPLVFNQRRNGINFG